MFGVSTTAAYGLHALICLAQRTDGWVARAETIASATGVPKPYLAKILHDLRRAGLVLTKRGHRGGYRLARRPEDLTLHDVITTLEGPDVFERCLLGLGRCSPDRGCPLHSSWSKERAALTKRFREQTLADLAAFDKWHVERDYRFGLAGGPSRRMRASNR